MDELDHIQWGIGIEHETMMLDGRTDLVTGQEIKDNLSSLCYGICDAIRSSIFSKKQYQTFETVEPEDGNAADLVSPITDIITDAIQLGKIPDHLLDWIHRYNITCLEPPVDESAAGDDIYRLVLKKMLHSIDLDNTKHRLIPEFVSPRWKNIPVSLSVYEIRLKQDIYRELIVWLFYEGGLTIHYPVIGTIFPLQTIPYSGAQPTYYIDYTGSYHLNLSLPYSTALLQQEEARYKDFLEEYIESAKQFAWINRSPKYGFRTLTAGKYRSLISQDAIPRFIRKFHTKQGIVPPSQQILEGLNRTYVTRMKRFLNQKVMEAFFPRKSPEKTELTYPASGYWKPGVLLNSLWVIYNRKRVILYQELQGHLDLLIDIDLGVSEYFSSQDDPEVKHRCLTCRTLHGHLNKKCSDCGTATPTGDIDQVTQQYKSILFYELGDPLSYFLLDLVAGLKSETSVTEKKWWIAKVSAPKPIQIYRYRSDKGWLESLTASKLNKLFTTRKHRNHLLEKTSSLYRLSNPSENKGIENAVWKLTCQSIRSQFHQIVSSTLLTSRIARRDTSSVRDPTARKLPSYEDFLKLQLKYVPDGFHSLHKTWAIAIQWLLPLLLSCFNSCDPFSIMDRSKLTEMSLRLFIAGYSFVNLANILEYGIPTERTISDIQDFGTLSKKVSKQFMYTGISPLHRGSEFRSDKDKGFAFGFELRVFDNFDINYVEPLLFLLVFLADHLHQKGISDITENPFNHPQLTNLTLRLLHQGWNTPIDDDYLGLLEKNLQLKIRPKVRLLRTGEPLAYDVINDLYHQLKETYTHSLEEPTASECTGHYSRYMIGNFYERDELQSLPNINRMSWEIAFDQLVLTPNTKVSKYLSQIVPSCKNVHYLESILKRSLPYKYQSNITDIIYALENLRNQWFQNMKGYRGDGMFRI